MEKFEQHPTPSSESYEFVDVRSPEIIEALKEAPIYHKDAMVHARRKIQEEVEHVETIVDGIKETANEARFGDWVVTQPGGESQVLTDTEFSERYEATDEPSAYKSKGFCRAIKNPFNKKIEILAPWNKQQIGDESCYLAITCKSDGSITQASPYIIQESPFLNMYKPFSE